MDSFAQSFTPEQIQDSDGGDQGVKKRRGRPPLTRTPEWIAARAASKKRGRGRPKVEHTPEQPEAFDPAAYEERRRIREAKKVERDAASKSKRTPESPEAFDPVAYEERRRIREAKKVERDAASKSKRTKIYEKMVADAAEYKAKWDL